MNQTIQAVVASVMIFLPFGAALAESTADPVVQKRMQNQDQRIDQGVKSGQLTPQETSKLEAQQAKIKQDEARMKEDGKLTKAERNKLRHEQNRASQNIYRKKHNANKAGRKH
ncbi:MAG: hypothetical protein H7833_17070 [Magnetococcus sp. DMHC-1]|nr:hypothetical protein [Magnetococcales bacterium]